MLYMQTPADAAVKKVPPPTKAKPKPPAQEVVKKPVLPPSAALASSTLANVLKEGRKVIIACSRKVWQQCLRKWMDIGFGRKKFGKLIDHRPKGY